MKTRSTAHRKLPLLILIVGIVLSISIKNFVDSLIYEKNLLRLEGISNEVIKELKESIDIMTYGLGGANGIFAASKHVEKNEFKDYVISRDLPKEFPGSLGFGFIEYVKRKDLKIFLKITREDGDPNFNIKTDKNHKDLFIIKFIEPLSSNLNAYGYDIGSEDIRREAAETAMRTGRPTLTKRIQLLQDSKNRAGFLYLKPVYKHGSSVNSVKEREQAIEGWVYTPVILEHSIKPAMAKYNSQLNISVFEGTENNTENNLYSSLKIAESQNLSESDARLTIKADINVGQQNWHINISPTSEFYTTYTDQYLPATILGLGILLSLLLSGFTWSNLSKREQIFSAKIKEGENFVQGILESANFSIIVTDPYGVIKVFNRTASEMLGYTSAEMIGKTNVALIHDEDEVVKKALALSSELGQEIEPGFEVFVTKSKLGIPDTNKWTYISKDGKRIPVTLSVTAIRDAFGNIVAFLGIANDISDAIIAEKQLLESEKRFKSSFSHASHGIALVDLTGRWIKVNPALCLMLGRSEEILLETTFQDITHPEDLNKDLELMQKVLSKEIESYHIEKRYFHKNGSTIWVLLSVSLVRDEHNLPIHFVSQIQDITNRKYAESALEESKTQLELVIESTDVGIWDWEISKRTILINERWAQILGYKLEEIRPLTFKSWLKYIHPDDRKNVLNKLREHWASNSKTYINECRLRHKKGYWIWALDTGRIADWDQDGKPTRMIGTHLDITERKRQEKDLIIAKEDAISAANTKSQFLANMSHEIRTPLTGIIGYSESLISDDLTKEEQSLALHTVIRNGNHLLGVINDILDISKIEAGKLEVEIISVDLIEILRDIKNLMQHKSSEKGLSLGFEYNFPIPGKINTDPIRLKQILINLVGNAVKFTQYGGIKVIVTHNIEAQLLEFSIIDTGTGITEDQQQNLFQAFKQADTTITRKFGGTGLGLVISNQLVQKLGGEVTVKSTTGKGSSFSFTIATGKISEEDYLYSIQNNTSLPLLNHEYKAPTLSGNVLVAEDGEDNRSLIEFLLKKASLNFTIVENGALAVEEAITGKFDIILMDIQMPVMDGYSATKQIRANGLELPIVALTANTMKSDIKKAYEYKFTDFLGKPFSRQEFFKTLEANLLASQNTRTPPSQTAETSNLDADEIELFQTIINKLPLRLSEISSAAENRDWEEMYRLAHSLKGSSGLIGLTHISNIAKNLETLAKNQKDDFAEDFETLEKLINSMLKEKDITKICRKGVMF